MSGEVERLLDQEEAASSDDVERLIRQGRAAELTEAALARIGSGDAYRRERALDRLEQVSDPAPLLPLLVEALRDAHRVERRNAARSALARLASAGRVSETLADLAARDPDRDVRILAATALGESDRARAGLEALLQATEDPDVAVAAAAVESLGSMGDPRALDRLAELAAGDDPWLRSAAVVALGALEHEAALPVLVQALADPISSEPAARALERLGDVRTLDAVRPLLDHDHPRVRRHALDAAVTVAALDPEQPPPDWLRTAAAERAADDPGRADDAAADDDGLDLQRARLLGVAGSPDAARLLVAHASEQEAWPRVVVGLELLPEQLRARTVLEGLADAGGETSARLIGTLGGLEERDAIERLAPLLAHQSGAVRSAAEEVLLRSDRATVVQVLGERADDDSGAARVSSARLLARLDPASCTLLADLLGDADANVRAEAARGLNVCDPGSVSAQLLAALDAEPEREVRLALIGAVGALGGEAAVDALRRRLGGADPEERFAIARALGRSRSTAALPILLDMLDDPEDAVAQSALQALGELGDPRASEPVARRMDGGDLDRRRTAAAALESLPSPAARQRLLDALEDEDWQVRLSAVRALRMTGGPEERRRLAELAAVETDPLVRREAAAAAGGATGGD